ncbi:rhotekin-2 isoform X3 [Pleurodeles waltl]|uniref:rhotekin-2 isoform X3 n=1 Tax=Pleurodeles waltl TaxID=8319 RepID=UPI0037096684
MAEQLRRDFQMFNRTERCRATVAKCSALGMEIKRKKVRETAVFLESEVEEGTVQPPQEQCHDLSLGNWVLVKKHVRKPWLEPCWKGPFQVILVTTAVKCAGLPNWVHASHTLEVPSPLEETVPVHLGSVTVREGFLVSQTVRTGQGSVAEHAQTGENLRASKAIEDAGGSNLSLSTVTSSENVKNTVVPEMRIVIGDQWQAQSLDPEVNVPQTIAEVTEESGQSYGEDRVGRRSKRKSTKSKIFSTSMHLLRSQ